MNKRIREIRIALGMQQGDFADKIDILQQQLSKYERGENKPSAEFFKKLAEKENVNINWLLTGKGQMFTTNLDKPTTNKAIEIEYYENPILTDTIKNPAISNILLDKELIHNVWQKNENNLKIMQMTGDIMDGGNTPIRNQDILLIDTSIKDVMLSGVYAYTTRNDNFIFVNSIKQKIDGSVNFYSWNPNYKEVIYNLSDLEKINFKVIGRVIKNLSSCF